MHVGILLAQLGIGGAERQFALLARELVARGHEVSFLTLFGGGGLEPRLSGPGLSVQALVRRRPGRPGLVLPRMGRLLTEALADTSLDVLYGGDYVSNWLAAANAAEHGVPVAWGIRHEGAGLPLKQRVLRRLGRPHRERVAVAIANSAAGLDFHRRIGYLPRRMEVVYNGVDLEAFRPRGAPEAAERLRTRAALGIPADAPTVGLVARYANFKDHANFLSAAERVVAQDSRAHFVCAAPDLGAFPREVLFAAEHAPLAGRLHFLEVGSDVVKAYHAIDVLASSSFAEGFSNVIVEAMACGVPCVVTDVGESRLAVGGTGRVVPARDPEALAEALREVLAWEDEERARTGQEARERVAERFGIGAFVGATERVLGEVAREQVVA